MVEIILNYNQINTTILANLEDSFNSVIEKFINKTQLDINNINFISNGNIISKNEKIINIMNDSEKINKQKTILVLSINSTINNDNTNMIKSKEIICPICKEICKYDIKNHKIKLYGCKKGHIINNINNIKLDEFNNKQIIDISQIKCDKCKNNSKSNTFNNEFYICCECNMNLCPLCKSIHDKNHSIINYDYKNYICNKHNETLFRYCENCNIDLCLSCINEHKGHKLLSYEDKLIDIKNLRKKMDNLNIIINRFKKNLEEIISKLKKLENDLDIYYNINNDIINYYEKNKSRNYNLLINLNNINNDIDNEIDKLKNEYNYGNNLNKLFDLYNEINENNIDIINNNIVIKEDNNRKNENVNEINENINDIKEDSIEINYKPDKDKEKLRIFGEKFVDNNKNKCRIIYKNKEYNLCEFIDDIDNDYKSKDIISIKLKDYNNIKEMSHMFSDCSELSSLPNIFKLNMTNIKDMNHMFGGCIKLLSLPDISKWNTSNVEDMSYIFFNCINLLSLPDISKWNTSNVKDITLMFCNCCKLSSLPDISNWNTSNVSSMSNMFGLCYELSSLPDISKWNTSNVNNMNRMFNLCKSLKSLPDISRWNTSNVNDMRGMFNGCKSLSSLPDISRWDISNLKDKDKMFNGCKSDLNIPSEFKN